VKAKSKTEVDREAGKERGRGTNARSSFNGRLRRRLESLTHPSMTDDDDDDGDVPVLGVTQARDAAR
jgi:hypothetical protein